MRIYAVILGILLIIGGYFRNDLLLTIFSHHNLLQELFGKKVFGNICIAIGVILVIAAFFVE